MHISELLKNRIQFFVDAINKDRIGTEYPQVSFIQVRQKLAAIREIEDLRWFYWHCKKYSYKKGNSFSKCFFGATKVIHTPNPKV